MKYILLISIIFGFSYAQMEKTLCYKSAVSTSSKNIENELFEGGECQGIKSITDMKKEGWSVSKKRTTNEEYIYILHRTEGSVQKASVRNIKLDFKERSDRVYNVTDETAEVKIPGLQSGQSGIIVHTHPNGSQMVLANAVVTSSMGDSSQLKFEYFDDVIQTALPKSNLKVKEGDKFILNHLYSTSIIIAPNSESFRNVRKMFRDVNFLHADIFSADLKREGVEKPDIDHFKIFCKYQNIGTLFFVIDDMVHIVDAKSFNILESYLIDYSITEVALPFYTRVDISSSMASIKSLYSSIFNLGATEVDNYNAYYSDMLGI